MSGAGLRGRTHSAPSMADSLFFWLNGSQARSLQPGKASTLPRWDCGGRAALSSLRR